MDDVEPDPRPLLYIACEEGHVETVRLLLDRGATVDRGIEIATPLMIACNFNRIDIAKLLLDRGADVNGEPSDPSMTPLMLACSIEPPAGPDIDLVRMLINRGADVSKRMVTRKPCRPCTALFISCYNGQVALVRLLLAQSTCFDSGWKSALDQAIKNGTEEMRKLFYGYMLTYWFLRVRLRVIGQNSESQSRVMSDYYLGSHLASFVFGHPLCPL